MIEILHPEHDRDRIVEHRRSGIAEVDGWTDAAKEYAALASLDPGVEPIEDADIEEYARYVVYPWRAVMVRLPESGVFQRLRTARNRYLISDDEQARWSEALIAVAGLSVGASLLHTCVLTGARRFAIADPDTLGLTNLNRLAGSVCDLGVAKSALAHRRMLETDPYVQVRALGEGFTTASADAFFGATAGDERPHVVLEEVDNLAAKVAIRRRARAKGIPLVMVTDEGDNVLLDIERYDLDPDYPLFHGRAGDVEALSDDELTDPANRVRIASAIVGSGISPRVRMALGEVGQSIPSWPQLGTAATLAGAVGATVARRIVCGDTVPSGRVHVRIDDLAGDPHA